MMDHTPELMLACQEAKEPDERATRALILADWWEEQGQGADAETVRLAVESGVDGLEAVLSVPSGGAGRAAGELKVMRLADVELRFRWCPPGSFTMGSPPNEEGRLNFEAQVDVKLTRGFWMQEVEVTQGLWRAANGPKLDWSKGAGPRLPVSNVSHDEALAFAASLTEQLRASGELPAGWRLSLPSEAQWEYAARAGTTTRFPWGDDESRLGDYAWYLNNSGGKPHDVGTLRANGWEIKDMLGNVWEWCLDGWSEQLPGGDDPLVDPAQSSDRVFRGGCWCHGARFCRPAYRNWGTPEIRDFILGFRLVAVQSLGEASR